MERELESAKQEADVKLKNVSDMAVQKVNEQFDALMKALHDKLDHEIAVRKEWEQKVGELESEVEELNRQAVQKSKSQPPSEPDGDLAKQEEFDSLRATVHALWDILEVDSEEAVSFMMAVQELASFSPSALEAYRQEERRLQAVSANTEVEKT